MLYSQSRTLFQVDHAEEKELFQSHWCLRHIVVQLFRASYYQCHTPQCTGQKRHTNLPSDQSYQNNKLKQLLLEVSSRYGPLNKPLKNDPIIDQNLTADHFSTTFDHSLMLNCWQGQLSTLKNDPGLLFNGVII